MKTNVIVVVILSLFCSCKSVIEEKSDVEVMVLHGKVKSMKEWSYDYVSESGEIPKSIESIRQFFFNEEGEIIEESSYDSKDWNGDEKFWKEIRKYNEAGQETERFNYDSLGIINWKEVYKYDRTGDVIEQIEYDSGGSIEAEYTFKYNRMGNIVETNYYRLGKIHIRQTHFNYDRDGNEIEQIWIGFDNSSELSSGLEQSPIYHGRLISKYDLQKNCIEERQYSSDDNLYSRGTFKYDEGGNKIESHHYDSEGNQKSKSIIKYDSKGQEIQRDWYNSEGILKEVSTYEFEFDEENNWTNKVMYLNDTLWTSIEREFEYFQH